MLGLFYRAAGLLYRLVGRVYRHTGGLHRRIGRPFRHAGRFLSGEIPDQLIGYGLAEIRVPAVFFILLHPAVSLSGRLAFSVRIFLLYVFL